MRTLSKLILVAASGAMLMLNQTGYAQVPQLSNSDPYEIVQALLRPPNSEDIRAVIGPMTCGESRKEDLKMRKLVRALSDRGNAAIPALETAIRYQYPIPPGRRPLPAARWLLVAYARTLRGNATPMLLEILAAYSRSELRSDFDEPVEIALGVDRFTTLPSRPIRRMFCNSDPSPRDALVAVVESILSDSPAEARLLFESEVSEGSLQALFASRMNRYKVPPLGIGIIMTADDRNTAESLNARPISLKKSHDGATLRYHVRFVAVNGQECASSQVDFLQLATTPPNRIPYRVLSPGLESLEIQLRRCLMVRR